MAYSGFSVVGSSPLASCSMYSRQPFPSGPDASVTLSAQQPNSAREQFEQPSKNGPCAKVVLSGQQPKSLSWHAELYNWSDYIIENVLLGQGSVLHSCSSFGFSASSHHSGTGFLS